MAELLHDLAHQKTRKYVALGIQIVRSTYYSLFADLRPKVGIIHILGSLGYGPIANQVMQDL